MTSLSTAQPLPDPDELIDLLTLRQELAPLARAMGRDAPLYSTMYRRLILDGADDIGAIRDAKRWLVPRSCTPRAAERLGLAAPASAGRSVA